MMNEFMREIFELLQDEGSGKINVFKDCECFALSTKYKKKGKSNKTFICYFVLMIFHFLILYKIVFPMLYGRSKNINLLINSSYILFGMCIVFNYFLSMKDPGFLDKE